MTVAILAGVGVGAAVLLIASGISPAPVPLERALARLGQPEIEQAPKDGSLDARLGARLRRLSMVERLTEMARSDLRVLRRDPDEQIAEIAAYAAVGLLWAPVVSAGALLLGYSVPVLVPLWLSISGAVGAVPSDESPRSPSCLLPRSVGLLRRGGDDGFRRLRAACGRVRRRRPR
jgi:hypothetical protein